MQPKPERKQCELGQAKFEACCPTHKKNQPAGKSKLWLPGMD